MIYTSLLSVKNARDQREDFSLRFYQYDGGVDFDPIICAFFGKRKMKQVFVKIWRWYTREQKVCSSCGISDLDLHSTVRLTHCIWCEEPRCDNKECVHKQPCKRLGKPYLPFEFFGTITKK